MGAAPAFGNDAGAADQGSPDTAVTAPSGDQPTGGEPPADLPPSDLVPAENIEGSGEETPVEPVQPEVPQGAAPSEETPSGAPEGAAMLSAPVIEAADPEPPYLRWTVADPSGSTAPGTVFTVQGPRDDSVVADDADSAWAAGLTSTVADNTGQEGYVGSDLDPAAGSFLVKLLVDDADATRTYEVVAAETYRVRPAEAADGLLVGDDAEWSELPVATAAEQPIAQIVLAAANQAAARTSADEALAFDIGIMMAGVPDGGDPPYVYWKAENAGSPVGGATFQFRYRSGDGWSGNINVTDCVSAPDPCAAGSLDRDPDPGEFLLMHRTTPFNSGNRLVDGSNYSVRQNNAPSGYNWSASQEWRNIGSGSGNSGTWNDQNGDQTHNFGTFQLTEPSADIVVRKRVLADPTGVSSSVSTNIGTNYSYTNGTVFRLYENTSNAPGAPTSYTCTITSGGECTITVTGADLGKRYWVVEDTPAAGTYSNPSLYVGSYNGPTEHRRLVGLTKELAASVTTYMPMTAGSVSGGTVITSSELPGSGAPSVAEAGSFGAVANSVINPLIDPKCEVAPLRIALVLDQSASIQSGQWTTFKNALVSGSDSVLGLLRDAGAYVSILGFGTNVSSPNGWHYGSTGPALLPSNYASLIPTSRPGGGSNSTNWDAALSTIQNVNASHDYDMVLFITDGAPNVILNGSQVSSYDVTLRSLEAPIYAANAIKANGTRVVAVGVGNGASGSMVAANLRAVSGYTPNSDFVQGNWDQVKDILTDIVKAATCTVPIEVSKTEIRADDSVVTNAGGWSFTSAKTGTGSTLSTPATKTTTAGVGGTAKWDLSFTQPSGQTADLVLTETVQPGWTLTNVQCTVAGVDRPVTIDENNAITITGLTASSEKVACVFTNTETPPTATVQVDKTWVITDETGATLQTYYQRGEAGDPAPPAWLQATPTLAPAPTPAPGPGGLQWGTPYGGYLQDGTVSIGETASLAAGAPPGCQITSKRLTSGPGIQAPVDISGGAHQVTLGAGSNEFGITNTVTCTTQLTLLKRVDASNVPASTMAPSDWRLTAEAGGTKVLDGAIGSLDTVTLAGANQNTATVTAGTEYTLSEISANGQLAYTQLGIEKCTAVTGVGASAECTTWDPVLISGNTVELALGEHAMYRFVNQPIPPITVPLTGGMSSDMFGIWGAGIVLLAVITGIVYVGRTQRRIEVR